MSVIKCKMCGGDLELIEGSSVAVCEYCGSQQTVPAADNEKKLTLFARANRLRLACEFDKAAGVYESIVADFPTEAEAYWGLVLCRYGIEYVDDPATGKKIPTCHRSSFDSVMEDSDFEQALENADAVARRVYRDEAKAIEELRRGIVEVSGKEPPYDIFICYKETAEDGQRTVDSVIAQDVYDALTEKGYRVFFSRISLEEKLGTEYEPYIFAALHSAKIMLAFGTDYEYYNAVWVKNEWSRYLQLMTKDKSKHLIPCYKGIDAYDMPKEFAKLQAQDMGKVGAMQDLLRGVDKIMGKGAGAAPAPAAVNAPVNATVDSLLDRAWMFLEDEDYQKAHEYLERVLDIDPRNSRAYLGNVLATLHLPSVAALDTVIVRLDTFKDFDRAMCFANEAEQLELKKIYDAAQRKYLIINIHDIFKHEVSVQEEAARRQEEANRRREEEARRQEEANRRREEEARRQEEEARRREEEARHKKELQEKMLEKRWVYHHCHTSSMVVCGSARTIGFRVDGTVLACGKNDDGQCNVSGWKDIVAVAAGNAHTVGLKSDGTVVACGQNASGQCDVSGWKDIVAVAAGGAYTVGLRSDGTVVACGYNEYGQCDVFEWTDIVAVAARSLHTVGLRSDGTVVACGYTKDGQCDVSGWKDIVAVAAGRIHTVGLRSDGTVVACGYNEYGQCDVSEWTDVVAVAAGRIHTVGLKSDGTVVACGQNASGQCDVSSWTDIVAVAANRFHTVGLKSDGMVVACGSNSDGRCDVSGWKLFDNFDDVVNRAVAEEEKRKAAAEKRRLDRIAALEAEKQRIETELPYIKGLFSGGKRRDMENRLAEIEIELKRLEK